MASRARRLSGTALIALIAIAVTLYFYRARVQFDRRLLAAETERMAEAVTLDFQRDFNLRFDAARRLRDFFASSQEVTDEEFASFAGAIVSRTQGFDGASWLDGSLDIVHAQPAEWAARLRTALPGPVGEAARKALATREPAAALTADGAECVLFIPTAEAGARGGMVAAELSVRARLDHLAQLAGRPSWEISVSDEGGRLLLGPVAESGIVQAATSALTITDQKWRVRVAPSRAVAASLSSGEPVRILVVGALATLALVAYNFLLHQRENRLREALGEKEQLSSAVEEAQSHVAELINDIDAIIWEADPETMRFFFVSDYAEKLLGYPARRWIEEPDFWQRCLHPDDRAGVMEAYGSVAETGQLHKFEHRMVGADGKIFWVRTILSIVHGSDGVARSRGIILDVTERVLAEEAVRQSQKLESIGVLAGGIAHDFNNLLTAIIGNAELAMMSLPEKAPTREPLGVILTTAQRLAELTRQMLAYSGKGRFVVSEFSLNDLINETSSLLAVTTPKNIRVVQKLESELPAIEGDYTQIQQVVLNLLTNAADAIGSKNGIIMISTGLRIVGEGSSGKYRLPPGLYVALAIRDTGCGMDAATLERIFDPFFTTKFTGRGLGLAALQGIVRGHKGQIEIESNVGVGTVFNIVLPAASACAPKREALPSAAENFRGSGKALVIDDEEIVRNVAADSLTAAGFEVVLARDGFEGVARFQENPDDIRIVLLDLTMPKMHGDEAFREIRKIRRDALVILTSGACEQEIDARFPEHKPDDFLHKPFLPSELIRRVSAVLNGTAAGR